MFTAAFRALDTDVEVRADDADVFATVRVLTDTYARSTRPPALTYQLETSPWGRVLRDGERIHHCDDKVDLPPVFELDLHRQAVARCAGGLALHGAALTDGERALVLVGESGAGKSTMSLALCDRGMHYLTDELLVVDAGGAVRGLSRPIAFDAPPRAPLPPGFTRAVCPIRLPGNKRGEHLLVHPPAAKLCHEPRPLGAVVRLRHAPGEPPGIRRMASGEALAALWAEGRRPGDEALAVATALLSRHAVYELTTRDVDEACGHVLAHWSAAAGAAAR